MKTLTTLGLAIILASLSMQSNAQDIKPAQSESHIKVYKPSGKAKVIKTYKSQGKAKVIPIVKLRRPMKAHVIKKEVAK